MYEQGQYECSTFFVITEQSSPYLNPKDSMMLSLSKPFLEEMCSKEQQIAQFLSDFYDYSKSLIYSNRDKICKIKELEIIDEL